MKINELLLIEMACIFLIYCSGACSFETWLHFHKLLGSHDYILCRITQINLHGNPILFHMLFHFSNISL